jgi:hypothetical protein
MRYAKPERIKPMSEPTSAFPPETIGAFLRCCAGEWMSLRSQFSLAASLDLGNLDLASLEPASLDQADLEPAAPGPTAPGEGEAALEEAWHSSERGELVVSFLEPEDSASVGGLRVAAGGKGPAQLHFDHQGGFTASGGEGQSQGSWQLWPDGSLELRLSAGERLVRERIWFTKANLRLRSTVEQGADGRPARASFSSEIRRVSRAAAAPGSSAAVTPPAN